MEGNEAEWKRIKKHLQFAKRCATLRYSKVINAMKETLAVKSDRNTASPTESAVCGKQRREHSGADCLKGLLCRAVRDMR